MLRFSMFNANISLTILGPFQSKILLSICEILGVTIFTIGYNGSSKLSLRPGDTVDPRYTVFKPGDPRYVPAGTVTQPQTQGQPQAQAQAQAQAQPQPQP